MKKLNISILLLLFVMILSITAVAAADDVTSDLAKSQNVDDSIAVAVDGNTNILATGEKNFTDLQKAIDEYGIVSNGNYVRADGDKDIVITTDVRIADTIIDANNKGGIFNVASGGKLTLMNVELKNGNNNKNGGAILNNGEVVIQGATFENNNASLGDAIYNNGILTIKSQKATFNGEGSAIHNTATGTVAINVMGSEFNQIVVNEGAFADEGSKFNNRFINNGTADLAGSNLATVLENYATVSSLFKAQVNTVLNNGTITVINNTKVEKLTNNGDVGTINAIATTIDNNGTITEIDDSTVTTLKNSANGNIITIDNVTVEKRFDNYGNILGIGDSQFLNSIYNFEGAIALILNTTVAGQLRNNASIGDIDNVTVDGAFRNYENGTIVLITDSNINGGFRNDNKILFIEDSTFIGSDFKNYGAIRTVDNVTAIEAAFNNYENATVGIVSDSKFKSFAAGNNVTVTLIEDSIFNGKFRVGENTTIDTIGNITVIGDFDNAGDIEEIVDSNITGDNGIYNIGNIGTIENVTALGLYNVEGGNITEIDDSVIGAFTNSGLIAFGITNTTVKGSVYNYGTIADIEDSTFMDDVYNEGNMSIEDCTFVGLTVNNNDNANMTIDGLFNASNIVNKGNLIVEDSIFFNAPNFINNNGNLYVGESIFINATNIALSNKGNATVDDSVFVNNKRETYSGGAIYNTGDLGVYDSFFGNNSAKTYGGAIYNNGIALIQNSTFKNNVAGAEFNGAAIYNLKNLTLIENTINTTHADIVSAGDGFITAINITVLNDNLYNYYDDTTLNATVTDDNGNWIYDVCPFGFLINGSALYPFASGFAPGDGYNNTTGVYSLTGIPAFMGDKNLTNNDHVVSAILAPDYLEANATAEVTNGTIRTIKGSFTELQFIIADTIDRGFDDSITLSYDFAYNPEFDNENLTKGVVINTDYEFTIYGNGSTISGANVARIFLINSTAPVNLRNITFTNGVAGKGAAIVANSTLRVFNSVFTDNAASENGGAIYVNVTSGQFVLVSNSKLTGNTANGTANAIYVEAGALNLINNTINTKVAEIVNFNGTINKVAINATILANQTINATYGEQVVLNATITDENGNLINDPFFKFTLKTELLGSQKEVPAVYADGLYTADYPLYVVPGVYEVNVAYNKSAPLMTITSAIGIYNISKATPTLILVVDDIIVGENTTAYIFYTGPNGELLNYTEAFNVTINNKNYEVKNITNGEAIIENISGLALGTYNAYVSLGETENYTAVSDQDDFSVRKATELKVYTADITYGETAIVAVSLTSNDIGLNKLVTIYVGDKTYNIATTDGYGYVEVKDLAAGTYYVAAEFAGDFEYAPYEDITSLTVNKVSDYNETITVSDPVVGEDATVTVTLPEDATGNLTVSVDGVDYNATVKDGVASVTIPAAALTAGNHTATVAYTGDDKYAPSAVSKTITVNGAVIVAENMKRGVNSPYDYSAKLVDTEGKPLAGKTLVFVIDGKNFTAVTDAEGIAYIAAGLVVENETATDYAVTVINPLTGENATATVTIVPRLIVISGDLTADYLENPPYVVQAIGDDGNPVGEGETVRVVFAGFYYDMTTNATGHVVRTIGLAPGMYAVKACYKDYNTTATVFVVKQVMKVTSGTLKKKTAKKFTLKATLKSSNGKALVGKEVKLTFNGKTYTVKTNAKGVASKTLSSSEIKKLKTKTYTLKAKYVNDVTKGKIKVVNK